MAITEKMLRFDEAMWYAKIGVDKHGVSQFAAPVKMNVRWDNKVNTILSPSGESVISVATVYVDRDISPGDALLHVAEIDMTDTQRDFPIESGALIVRRVEKIGNIRQRRFVRTCYL